MATIEEAVLRVKIDPGEAQSGGRAAERALEGVAQQARVTASDVGRVDSAFDSMGGTLGKLKTVIAGALGGLSAGLLFNKMVQEVIAYEDALIRVTRTTNYTAAQTERFTAAIDDAVLSMPLAEDGMMAIAEAAAKMGIRGEEELSKLAITMQKFATVTGSSGAEATKSILRLLTATKTSADQADELASVFTLLGKESKASAGEIMEISQKLGVKAGVFGLKPEDIAALAAGMASLGGEGRMAVGGIVQIMDSMREAVTKGGSELENLGKLMGMTGDEAAAAFRKDATDAMLQFTEGVANATKSGASYSSVLQSIGVNSDGLLQVLPAVVNTFDAMKKMVGLARKEMGNAVTLQDQMEKSSKTLGARMTILGNTIAEAFEEGKVFSDVLKRTADFASGVIRAFFGMDSAIAPVTESMTSASNAMKGLIAGFVTFGALKAAQMFMNMVTAIRAASVAMGGLNAVMAANPIGLVAVAVGTLVALFLQFRDATFQIGETTYTVQDVLLAVWDTIKQRITFVIDFISDSVEYWIEYTKELFAGGFDWIINALGPFGKFFRDNWKSILDNVLGFIRQFVNVGIGLFKTMIDSLVILVRKLGDAAKALAAIYKVSTATTTQDLLEGIQQFTQASISLDASGISKDITLAMAKNMNTDFVGMGFQLGKDFVQSIVDGIKSNPDLQRVLKFIFPYDTAENFVANLKKRQKESADARARAAWEAANQGFVGPPTPDGFGVQPDGGFVGPPAPFAGVGENAVKAKEEIQQLYRAIAAENEIIVKFKGDQDAMNQARERATEIAKMQSLAEEAYGKNTTAAADEVKKYTLAFEELQRARAASQATTQMEGMQRSLEEERRLLGLSSDEREKAILVSQYEAEAMKKYGSDVTAAKADVDAFRQSIVDLQQDRNLVTTFQEAGAAISGAFVDAAFNARNLQDVMKGLLQQLTQIALTRLVMQPIMGQFGSMLGSAFQAPAAAAANGAVLNRGDIVPFARGGVVGSPTLFPMSRGRTGVMGESGPEAIMPLQRDSSGRLGVRGGGGGVTINVYTPDAESFRQSRPQMISQMQRVTRGG
jgi:TP901 family phage tail tape measure protein